MGQLEESLRRLQTDHVDEWRMHNIWNMEELDKLTAPAGPWRPPSRPGAGEGAIHQHERPPESAGAGGGAERFPFDSMLVALSALDHFILSFAEEFLPVANAQGDSRHRHEGHGAGEARALLRARAAVHLALPVSTTIVGMESMDQLKRNLAVAENFTPLGDEEKLEFFKEIVHLATPAVMRWKTTDYFNPVEWEKR